MSLQVGCPRCAAPVAETGDGGYSCPEHELIAPLWRTTAASYDDFAGHLGRVAGFPTYLPWPLGPGWSVTDFAGVADDQRGRATMTCVSGTSALDGPVDVIVVSEEAGTGLGARIAGLGPTGRVDPGEEVGEGPATVKVRIGSFPVGLWPVSVSGTSGEWDRSVVVGEAEGRWLWIILRPASAILLLRDDWILRDVSETGPQLVALPFGGPAPLW
ncbi:hypothetical protein F0U44_09795 [Nocardioides humilatus]|uniref:Uncharacterized protein n=1 Tax=Nocardioides humilatus TaxID=2607660 RepID=A0A5B1LDF8_9ACTN|nr:DUF6758 family protein [Nocardioides humilatus]KAA1418773.1 hypothetical protein F0U44_09795 [Nocardioides humilatus]